MNANLSALLYLVAGVLFILSLRGLSSPATSRQGNLFGMVGMISSGSGWARGFGFIALIFACVNIFGGFLVTQRMLGMYKKKSK